MPGVNNFWLNLIGFQAAWWACALWGNAGALFALTLLIIHMAFHPNRSREMLTIVVAASIGLIIDGQLAQAGLLGFEPDFIGLPFWLFVLWGCFAATLNQSLAFLRKHTLWAVILGAFSGPATYYGGAMMGRLEFFTPSHTFLVMAATWAILLPGLLQLAHLITSPAREKPK